MFVASSCEMKTSESDSQPGFYNDVRNTCDLHAVVAERVPNADVTHVHNTECAELVIVGPQKMARIQILQFYRTIKGSRMCTFQNMSHGRLLMSPDVSGHTSVFDPRSSKAVYP